MDRLERVRRIVAKELPPAVSDNPYQRPLSLFYPDLPTKPFYDGRQFAWTQPLRDGFRVLRDELTAALQRREGFEAEAPGFADSGKWAALWFHRYGERVEENCDRFPGTMNLLELIPRLAGMACFSAVAPGTHIRTHCGWTNAKLRLHYAIQAEPGSRLRVEQSYYEWREGEIRIFDDSLEHEVWIGGHRPRIVLLLDFYHPDLSETEVEFLKAFEETPMALLGDTSLRARHRRIHNSFKTHPNFKDAAWLYDAASDPSLRSA